MEKGKESVKNQIILRLSRCLVLNDAGIIEDAIQRSMEDIAGVFDADRAFFFLTEPNSNSFSVAYEWYRENMHPVKPTLQGLKFRDYMIWGKFSQQKPCFQIHDTNHIPDSYPFDSKLFRDTACNAFIQKALLVDSEKIGFVALLKNQAGYSWDESQVEFLEITSELFKNLIIRLKELSGNKPGHEPKLQTPPNSLPKVSENLSLEMFDKVFGNLHYGIAVFDTGGQKFIYFNAGILELFGFAKTSEFTAREVFRVFRSNGYTIKDFFSAAQQRQIKDFALSFQNRHLSGTISPVNDSGWIVMSVADITPLANYEKTEKRFNQQMQILSEAAIELIAPNQEKEDIFQFIGETAFSLLDNAVVLVNRYNEQEGYLQTVFFKGIGNTMDSIVRLMGKHPLNKRYPLEYNSEEYKDITNIRTKELKGGITSLSLGTLADPVALKIEKLLEVDRIFVCGLYAEERLYGSLTYMLRSDSVVNAYILDTFARIVSSALHAWDTGSTLKKTSRVLSDAASIARISYWEYDFCRKNFTVSEKLFHILEPGSPGKKSESYVLPLETFLTRYVYAGDAPKIKELLETASKNKNKKNFAIDIEFRLVTSSGRALFVYTRGVIQKGTKIMGVAQDVSQLKKVEKSLWESELKFQNLVEQSLDAIVVVKDDGVITEWNPSAQDITGLESSKVIGRYAWEIESDLIFNPSLNKKHPQQPHGKLKERFFRFFSSSNSQKPSVSEITIKNQCDEIRYLAITSFVFTASQRKYLCRISKDITLEKQKQEREKQLEITQKAAKAKDLFLDNMSHEMRTPLSGIIGMADILMNTQLSSPQQEMLNVLKESSDSLLELISNIHELSRIEADGVVLQQNPFNMNSLLEKTLSIFKASAFQKNIQLNFEDNTPGDIMLVGDEFRLQQVIGNLVANAVKFTPEGGKVEVLAHATAAASNKLELRVEIKDTGIGVPQDKIPILFEKFTQVDNSYTREYDGIGIGLSISREIIRLMGGEIGVTSEQRKGSVFWFQLKLPFADA